MIAVARVVRDCYRDSVALLAISARLRAHEGVDEASVTMATAANIEAAAELGLLDPVDATPSDVLLVVCADSESIAGVALDEAVEWLVRPPSLAGDGDAALAAEPCTSLRDAAREHGGAVALISVPGPYAAAEARKALDVGLHVMIFSDNVTVEDEVALKTAAARQGLLVMGPDCGTAVLDGVPLGFANVLRRGPVGLIGASGTGLQEVASQLHRLGGGVSQLIGTGGRDLSAAVGGLSTLAALDLLGADAATEVIVLVSKPPDAAVANRVLQRAATVGKPVVAALLGFDEATVTDAGVIYAPTLAAAAHLAAASTGLEPSRRSDLGPSPTRVGSPAAPGTGGSGTGGSDAGGSDAGGSGVEAMMPPGGARRWLRGLFSGGTLAYEAQLLLAASGVTVRSNAPAPGQLRLDGGAPSDGHTVVDLGADEYTQGRPHPMIDPAGRDQAVVDALADDDVAVVLFDVVLGHGAAADPVGPLLALLADARLAGGARPNVVAHVCGTDEDPVGRARVVTQLEAVGVWVADSNAAAADAVARLLRHAGATR